MDQDAFRDTYAAVNERRCAYEKAVLTGNCGCSLARCFCIAEREGVRCATDAGQARCLDFLARLRAQARFALRTTDGRSALPHAKAMRVQVGGLRGVRAALAQDADLAQGAGADLAPSLGADKQQAPIDDVDALLARVEAHFGGLAELPYQRIVQQIAAYRGRPSFGERRRARKRQDDDEPT